MEKIAERKNHFLLKEGNKKEGTGNLCQRNRNVSYNKVIQLEIMKVKKRVSHKLSG